jgi:hypothetical protein
MLCFDEVVKIPFHEKKSSAMIIEKCCVDGVIHVYGRDGIGWVLLYMSFNATMQAKQAISDGDADGESTAY